MSTGDQLKPQRHALSKRRSHGIGRPRETQKKVDFRAGGPSLQVVPSSPLRPHSTFHRASDIPPPPATCPRCTGPVPTLPAPYPRNARYRGPAACPQVILLPRLLTVPESMPSRECFGGFVLFRGVAHLAGASRGRILPGRVNSPEHSPLIGRWHPIRPFSGDGEPLASRGQVPVSFRRAGSDTSAFGTGRRQTVAAVFRTGAQPGRPSAKTRRASRSKSDQVSLKGSATQARR
jgi:hypothetical protein